METGESLFLRPYTLYIRTKPVVDERKLTLNTKTLCYKVTQKCLPQAQDGALWKRVKLRMFWKLYLHGDFFPSLTIRKSNIIWQSYVTDCNLQLEAPKATKVYYTIPSLKAAKAESWPELKFIIKVKVNSFFSCFLNHWWETI